MRLRFPDDDSGPWQQLLRQWDRDVAIPLRRLSCLLCGTHSPQYTDGGFTRANFCLYCGHDYGRNPYSGFTVRFRDGESVSVRAVNRNHAQAMACLAPDAELLFQDGEWLPVKGWVRHPLNIVSITLEAPAAPL